MYFLNCITIIIDLVTRERYYYASRIVTIKINIILLELYN